MGNYDRILRHLYRLIQEICVKNHYHYDHRKGRKFCGFHMEPSIPLKKRTKTESSMLREEKNDKTGTIEKAKSSHQIA